MKERIRKIFEKEIDGTGLALFRISYSLILLGEILHMFYFRHLIFDKIPYLDKAEISFSFPILIWAVSVFCLLIGFKTRFASILNYLMGMILVGNIASHEYHVFYTYMTVNFIMMFLPVSQCLSVDRILMKLKYSNEKEEYVPSKKVSQLYYFLPLYLGIALVYFDSVFIKFSASSWLQGLGMWMPASMPMMAHTNQSWLLNQKYVMMFLGYLTLIFEAIYIFVFYRKSWRLLCFFIGFMFHIGILVIFPIPFFALTVCAVYLLMIPVSYWQKLFSSKTTKEKTFIFYYSSDNLKHIRIKLLLEHYAGQNRIHFQNTLSATDATYFETSSGKMIEGFDKYVQVFRLIWFLKPFVILLKIPFVGKVILKRLKRFVSTDFFGSNFSSGEVPKSNIVLKNIKFNFLYFVIVFFTVAQLIFITNSPVVNNFKSIIGIKDTETNIAYMKQVNLIKKNTKFLFGLTSHPVFIDNVHYEGYNHIIAVVYVNKNGTEEWLPLIDKNGQPSYYNYGTNWRKYSFSTNGRYIKMHDLEEGIRDYTAFWAKNNGVDLTDATFVLKVKTIDTPMNWEKDFLNKQIDKKWVDGGQVKWKDQNYYPAILDIEKL